MLKIAFKSIFRIILSLALAASIAVSTGAADDEALYDTVELKNGDRVTGTVLNNTFTITSPYTLITVKKDQISEIKINPESENHDIIELNVGGSLEGTIEEPSLSFKLISGKIISLEKTQCKKITLRRKAD